MDTGNDSETVTETPEKRIGRAAAINAKCKDCIYDPYSGGSWRKQVEECDSTDCALWPWRPKRILRKSSENAEEESDGGEVEE